MYETGTEAFALCENIGIEVLKEMGVGAARYALIRIGLFGKTTYAVCVLGDGYAFETLGENAEAAEDLFELIAGGQASPEHVFDIVTDARRERDARRI